MIFERSEGNPYFMHEIIHSMINNDALSFDSESNSWSMTSIEGLVELPDSLQGILQEHIANLSPEERHVLQVASVIGNQFWDRLLSEAIDMKMDDLLVHLTGLLRNQLIIEGAFDPVLGMSYSFNSS